MTKEEFIDYIIERYKGFENKGRIDIFNCCPEIDCDYCPFGSRDCTNGIAMSLLDRLVKVEEHQKAETNLEHFKGTVIVDMPNSVVYFDLKNGWEESYSHHKDVIDWFLSPYEEPPKPTYKLAEFEYDMLECYHTTSEYGIKDFWMLEKMQDKGYFKDIPNDISIKDILANCEVVEEWQSG